MLTIVSKTVNMTIIPQFKIQTITGCINLIDELVKHFIGYKEPLYSNID